MMRIARLPQRRLRKTLALGAVNEVLMLLLWLTCWVSGAAEFPMPETYGEDGLPRYMEAAAAFLNNSPESIYAPRVAFDALVLAKDDPKRIELRGDLEVSLIIDYSVDAEKAGLKRQVGGTPAKKCPRLGREKRAKNARPTPTTCQSSSRPRSKAH